MLPHTGPSSTLTTKTYLGEEGLDREPFRSGRDIQGRKEAIPIPHSKLTPD